MEVSLYLLEEGTNPVHFKEEEGTAGESLEFECRLVSRIRTLSGRGLPLHTLLIHPLASP